MKNAMMKNSLREIIRTPGRYIAIICIIALGVGFFSGLTVTKQTMLDTADDYVTESQLYDFKLLSTIGFDEEDIAAVSGITGVRAAEGAYSFDFIEANIAENSVISALSITDNLNYLTLEAGRMPSAENECVADSRFFHEEDIGREVTLSADNTDETFDAFVYDAYKIVGIVTSPEYMNMQRGTSKAGTGRVSGFVYLMPDGFSSEYYTAAYVKLDSDNYIFSDEYDENADEIKPKVTEAAEQSVNSRYRSLYSEAEEKIKDGESKRADAEKELLNAENDLSAGKKELEEAEESYNQGVSELERQRGEYDSAVAELSESRALLEEKAAELEKKKDEYDALLNSGMADEATLAAYKMAIDAGDAEINAGIAQLDSAVVELEKYLTELNNGKAELEAHKKELEEAKIKLADGEAEIEQGRAELKKAEEEILDARKELEAFEEPDIYTLTRYQNTGFVSYESDSSIVEGIAKVFPVFFFLVAALVCSTTMTKMVDEGRTQIGTLKAMGYGNGAIMAKYIGYAGSAAVIGSAAGFLVCTYLIPQAIWTAYTMLYDFTDSLKYVFDAKLALISLAVALVCSVGAAYFACRAELAEKPAELIRPKAPKAGKRILLERIPLIWKPLKFLHKVSLRNIFRYKKRLIMMMLGIGGCTALVVTGFGLRDSIKNIVSFQFDEITTYDISAVLKNPCDDEFLEKFSLDTAEYSKTTVLLDEITADVAVSNGIISTRVIVTDDEKISEVVDLHERDGNAPIPYPSYGKAVINRKIAELGGYSVGSKLEVSFADDEKITLDVSGICENYVYNYVYMTEETYSALTGHEPEKKTVYMALSDGTDPHEAAAFIMGLDGVSNVTVSEDIKNHVSDMMKSMDFVIAIVIGCAAALAFVVLFNLSNINITERAREIATIKVLGFYPPEVHKYVFRENIILTALGIIVGIPLGVLLHTFVMGQIKIDMVSFDVRITLISFAASVLLTFVFTIIVGIVMQPKLNKISMAESLKSIE